MHRTNTQMNSTRTRETRRPPGTATCEYNQQTGVYIAQRNFMSHSEFPDVKFAASITSQNKGGNSISDNGIIQRHSTRKIAKFRPFDQNAAPTHFRNGSNKTVDNPIALQQQNQQQQQKQQIQNQNFFEGQQFYAGQGQPIYQYIPPQEFSQTPSCRTKYSQNIEKLEPSATAVAPNGEKIFIPLDNTKYEIKGKDHDLYDMPDDCNLHVLSSEGQFESSVQLQSPRPICVRGSLSDEWSSSSNDGPFSDTESERETDQETGTDSSEIASHFVADVLKTITKTVSNVSLQSTEEKVNNVQTMPIQKHDHGNLITKELKIKVDENKGAEMPETCSEINFKKNSQEQHSSISEEEKILTPKQVKFETKSKRFDMNNQTPKQSKEDTKCNKKTKDKKTRAWKENRKEKREKTLSTSKKERKTVVKNDKSIEVNELKQKTQISLDTHVLKSNKPEHVGIETHSAADENVIIDGQYYFQSPQFYGEQYQHYYIPDFVHPEYYRQNQYSSIPEYTMFIHDVCPPPSKDEVFSQVHKSLSGEVINNQAASYQQEITGPGICQSKNLGQVEQMAYNHSLGNDNILIQCNREEVVGGINEASNYGAANDSSYNYTNLDQVQPAAYIDLSSRTEIDPIDGQSTGQGQLFISYDEDSVYVDPESGLSFPALHMTDDFLVTVILREEVFLEITANKVLRLVNHEKKLVVAINDTGNKSCIIHPAARIYQSDSNVHTELYLDRRAKMTEEFIMFGNKSKTYKIDRRMVTEMTEEPKFRDMSHDDSVTFLSTDDDTGNDEMKFKMEEILAHAHFWKNGARGSTTIINGTKIVQNEQGDVSVYCGPITFLRMNPEKMILRIKTRFIEVDIETNWNVKITRGSHALNASHMGFIVCNGKLKACLDSNNRLQSFSMPDHRFLMLGQPVSQHRPWVPRGQSRRAPTGSKEPEGDHQGYIRHDVNDDQSCFRDWEQGWDCDIDIKNCQKRWDPMAGRWVYYSRQWPWR